MTRGLKITLIWIYFVAERYSKLDRFNFSEGTEEAYNEALANLRHYTVVGTLERFRDFLAVLECLIPSYFKGAVSHYKGMLTLFTCDIKI